MKRTVSILLAVLMAVSCFCFTGTAAASYSTNLSETIAGFDVPFVSSGVYVYTNDTSADKQIPSGANNFRSAKLLIFSAEGKLIEAGGDLIDLEDRTNGSPQGSVRIPAGGFAVAFSASGNPNLEKCRQVAMEGAMLYNATMSVLWDVQGSYNVSKKELRISYNPTKAVPAGAKRFLIVGNSATYFNGTPIKFKGLCEAAGVPVVVDYCTFGSARLSEFADETHERGKALRSKLNGAKYDFVVLQDASGSSAEATNAAVETIMPLITKNGATPLFYMRYQDVLPSNEAKFTEQTNRFLTVYGDLAEKYDTAAAPAVTAFYRCVESNPEINLYADDNSHHSKEGSYLIACTWLYAFLGIDPVGNAYDAQLPADVAKTLQTIAKNAVDDPMTLLDDGSSVPVFKSSDGKKYDAISVGKDYTRTGTPYTGTWQDVAEDGSLLGKMTDGKVAITGDDPSVGCFKGATTTVTVDLTEMSTVKGFFTDLWGGNWGVPAPTGATASVAFSEDGKTFSEEYAMTSTQDMVGSWSHAVFKLDLGSEQIAARYVRFTYKIGGSFCWTSEAVVYGVQGQIPSDEPDPEPEPDTKKGDVNGDGVLNAFDYQMVKAYVLGTYSASSDAQKAAMDVNGDGIVNAFDYQMIKAAVLGTYSFS